VRPGGDGDGQGVPIKGGNPLGERSLLGDPLGRLPILWGAFQGDPLKGIFRAGKGGRGEGGKEKGKGKQREK